MTHPDHDKAAREIVDRLSLFLTDHGRWYFRRNSKGLEDIAQILALTAARARRDALREATSPISSAHPRPDAS